MDLQNMIFSLKRKEVSDVFFPDFESVDTSFYET